MRNCSVLLFVCSGFLLSGGVVLGVSSGWCMLKMSYFFWTTDLGPELSAGVLFVAASMLCLPACWLATLVPYHPRTLSLLAMLMLLSTAAILIMSSGLSSISALSRVLNEPVLLNNSMRRSMERAQHDPAVRSAFSSMQLDLHCCGVKSYLDWFKHRYTLPAACCNRKYKAKRDSCDTPVYIAGCLQPALVELRDFVNSISILSSTLIVVLAVTMFASAYTLVSFVIEREDLNLQKRSSPGMFRVACLHSNMATPQLLSLVPPPPAPLNNVRTEYSSSTL